MFTNISSQELQAEIIKKQIIGSKAINTYMFKAKIAQTGTGAVERGCNDEETGN